MITPELNEYIKKCREQNISDEQIKTALKEQGWSDEDMNAAINFSGNEVASNIVPPAANNVLEQQKTGGVTKQKSLFWIISTLYLTMILSGAILMIPVFWFGAIIILGFPYAIRVVLVFFMPLIAYFFALKIGVGYIAKKTIIPKVNIVKISVWVAFLAVVIYLIANIVYLGIDLWDALIVPCAVLMYFSAKYFLEKKAT